MVFVIFGNFLLIRLESAKHPVSHFKFTINTLQISLLLDSILCWLEMSIEDLTDFMRGNWVIFIMGALKLMTTHYFLDGSGYPYKASMRVIFSLSVKYSVVPPFYRVYLIVPLPLMLISKIP